MYWMTLPLRRYFDFSGRSRRKEYWLFALFLFLIYMAFVILILATGAGAFLAIAGGGGAGAGALSGGALAAMGLFGLFVLAIVIPSLAVAVRRLHDTDRTGWWVVAPVAPNVIGAVLGDTAVGLVANVASFGLSVALLVFYVLDGTPGPNTYGENPKAPPGDMADVFR